MRFERNIRLPIVFVIVFFVCLSRAEIARASFSPAGAKLPDHGLSPSIRGGGIYHTTFDADNPSPLLLGFYSDVWAVSESEDAEIFVTLSAPSEVPISVDYSTVPGSALPNQDYSETFGTLTFSPGATESSFVVPLNNNGAINDEKSLSLILTNPIGADLQEYLSSATLHILNDDTDSSYSNSFSPSENEGKIHLDWELAKGLFSVFVEGINEDTVQMELNVTDFVDSGSLLPPVDYVYSDTYVDIDLIGTDSLENSVEFAVASLCIPYTDDLLVELDTSEDDLRLLHCKDGLWEDITTDIDATNKRICGSTNSFSPFVLASFQVEVLEEISVTEIDQVSLDVLLEENPIINTTPVQSDELPVPDALSMELDAGAGVDGTSLSIQTYDVSFPLVELNGYSQNISGFPSQPWIAIDSSGVGAGWRVSISASNFLNQSGKTIPVQNLSVQLLDENIISLEGNEKPYSTFLEFSSLSEFPQVIASAPAGTGMGSYSLLPEFSLIIPANAYSGQYQSVFTVEIISGP